MQRPHDGKKHQTNRSVCWGAHIFGILGVKKSIFLVCSIIWAPIPSLGVGSAGFRQSLFFSSINFLFNKQPMLSQRKKSFNNASIPGAKGELQLVLLNSYHAAWIFLLSSNLLIFVVKTTINEDFYLL